jgi:isoleucyl-tRNA synthetase
VLDVRLTPELIEEGFVREVISKVQTMRKEADFEVTDRITLYISGNDTLAEIVRNNEEQLKGAVLATEVVFDAPADGAFSKEWDINKEHVLLGVAR